MLWVVGSEFASTSTAFVRIIASYPANQQPACLNDNF